MDIFKSLFNNIKEHNQIVDIIGELNSYSFIHIYGGIECGKTSLAKSIVETYSDKAFIYIDTYGNINNLAENAILFRTNREVEIVDFINKLNPSDCDSIILDAYSNILAINDSWNIETYIVMNQALKAIHTACIKKKCSLILLNTLNSNNKAFNETNYLKHNCTSVLLLNNYDYVSNTIDITPIKSRCRFTKF